MSPTILVLDDFASVRLYHMSFLKRKGYDCLGAASGEEALTIPEQRRVDLILLDLDMPGMDGRAFHAQLAAHPRHARLPVLVITSETPAQADFSALSRPVGILTKPVNPAALLLGVHQLLPVEPAAAPAVTAG